MINTTKSSSIAHPKLLTSYQEKMGTLSRKNTSIHEMFESQVERTPDAIALVFEGEQMTYTELNCRANKIAHHLRTLGVGPEVLVGICVERSLAMIVGLLGILKSGGAYVPLDPTYPPERLAFMLKDAQMPVLLTQTHLVSVLPEHGARVVCLDTNWKAISPSGMASLTAKESEENPVSGVTSDNLAYIIYTSGSTGRPKGVLVQHSGLCNLALAQQQLFNIQPDSRVLQFASLSFDASIWEIVMALVAGATLVLGTPDSLLPGPSLIRLLRDQAITTVTLAPLVLAILPAEELPALRTIIVAGEVSFAQLMARWAPGRRFFNAYGPTEATVCATVAECTHYEKKRPIGYPIANTQVYLLDTNLQPVATDVPGEIYIGGAGLARGYLNSPALTAERFIPNPFSNAPGARLYKTGDLARYLPNDDIEFLSRIDNQVKMRGFRIEPGEIEALLSQHPDVRQTVVIAREDILDNKRLVAYVVPSQERIQALAQQELTKHLRDYLREYLPDYMVPSAFLILDALPLTPNGKLDRRALPALSTTRSELEESFVAPHTPIEQMLTRIWTEVLGVEKVGIHDSFFDLGGNSLQIAQLITCLQEVFQIALPVRCLFEAPTVATLAQTIEFMLASSSATFWAATTTDLKAEVVLDAEIYPQGTPVSSLSEPRHIFLTGATGFLGAFLLHELLEQTQALVYCLIRSPNEREGLKRLQRNLEKNSLWRPSFSSRIISITGDLTKPLLGLGHEHFERLAAQIDTIYHSGSQVNFVQPYSLLKAANVFGTQEVLRLACRGKVKPVHYISTAAVFGTIGYFTGVNTIQEEDNIDNSSDYLYMGYTQSKWVAEKIVWMAAKRGVPVSIFRPGLITGHSKTGIGNIDDFSSRLIKGCIQLGSFPALVDKKEEFIPVDYATRAIIHLSRKKESLGKAFHLVPTDPIQFIEFFDLICSYGYKLKKLPYTKWKDELIHQTKHTQDNALFPFLPMLTENLFQEQLTLPELYQNNPYFDCQNTLNGLAGASIVCPPMNAELLSTYFSYFIDCGFLAPGKPRAPVQ